MKSFVSAFFLGAFAYIGAAQAQQAAYVWTASGGPLAGFQLPPAGSIEKLIMHTEDGGESVYVATAHATARVPSDRTATAGDDAPCNECTLQPVRGSNECTLVGVVGAGPGVLTLPRRASCPWPPAATPVPGG